MTFCRFWPSDKEYILTDPTHTHIQLSFRVLLVVTSEFGQLRCKTSAEWTGRGFRTCRCIDGVGGKLVLKILELMMCRSWYVPHRSRRLWRAWTRTTGEWADVWWLSLIHIQLTLLRTSPLNSRCRGKFGGGRQCQARPVAIEEWSTGPVDLSTAYCHLVKLRRLIESEVRDVGLLGYVKKVWRTKLVVAYHVVELRRLLEGEGIDVR